MKPGRVYWWCVAGAVALVVLLIGSTSAGHRNTQVDPTTSPLDNLPGPVAWCYQHNYGPNDAARCAAEARNP